MVGGSGLAWEAVGRVGHLRGGVREEWRRENERGSERGGNGSAAARQRGRKGGGSGHGVPWGLAPTGGQPQHQPERGAGGRHAPRTRVPAGQRGERDV
jgi:hypothetical protein